MLANLFEQIQDAADGAADVMALDGIDPRAYNNIEADIRHDTLPVEGALKAAGAMALLMTIADQLDEPDGRGLSYVASPLRSAAKKS